MLRGQNASCVGAEASLRLFTLVLLGLQEIANTFPCSLSIAYGFSYIPLIECASYQADLQFLEIKVCERPDDT